jgi:hypothetical protein
MADAFLYFAYGSNMYTRRLRGRTSSATCVGTGFVERHRLTFDKVSGDGSGKCNIESTTDPADRVYGVLFSISSAEAPTLDKFEGLASRSCVLLSVFLVRLFGVATYYGLG